MNIFYQLIGFGALIAMGLSYWQNDKRTILLWQVVANLIFAIHYTLLHACSGALCSFFQIVVLLLFLLQEKFNWSKLVTAIPIVAVFLLIAVVTYETPVTVLPIVASLAALLPFFQSRRWVIQMAGIASGLSWLMYVIAVHNAAENMVGGEGAGESVCLRGRSTDPCLRGAQRSLIKKVFKSKCNKTPFPCITRMTGEKAHAQYADDNRICAGRGSTRAAAVVAPHCRRGA